MVNWKRLVPAALAAWVASLAAGFVVNTILLVDLFLANQAVFRAEGDMMAGLPLGFGAMLIGFLAFAYAYAKGYEGGSSVVEGLKYGFLIGLMIVCFSVVWNYVTVPMSGSMGTAFAIDYLIEFSIYGAIVGAIYKNA